MKQKELTKTFMMIYTTYFGAVRLLLAMGMTSWALTKLPCVSRPGYYCYVMFTDFAPSENNTVCVLRKQGKWSSTGKIAL